MKELLEEISKLKVTIIPVNVWTPNPKYKPELRGKVQSHFHDDVDHKMVDLDEVIKIINQYTIKE